MATGVDMSIILSSIKVRQEPGSCATPRDGFSVCRQWPVVPRLTVSSQRKRVTEPSERCPGLVYAPRSLIALKRKNGR